MTNQTRKKGAVALSHDFDTFEQFLDDIDSTGNVSKPARKSPGEEKTLIGSGGGAITFIHPRDHHTVSQAFLRTASIELLDYLQAKELRDRNFDQFLPLIALPGDVLATQEEIEKPEMDFDKDIIAAIEAERSKYLIELLPGSFVRIDSEGKYVAEQYGMVCLEGNMLSIISPLKISSDLIKVDWLVPAGHPQEINQAMLDYWLEKAGVKIDPEVSLPSLIDQVSEGRLEAGVYTIVIGKAPIHGEDGSLEWLVNMEQSIGLELDDGRIDFKERNFIVNVLAGQNIARLKQATRGINGVNIRGKKLLGKNGRQVHLIAGENVQQKKEGDLELYVAEIEGALHYVGNRVYVSNVLNLHKGVNYHTGNIDFAGDVVVSGPIAPGFTIRAGGDVIVSDSLENGTYIEAQGSVIVSRSISGKRTYIKAGQNVLAQQVNEATVRAMHDIILGNYSMHAKLRAVGLIQVQKGIGEHGGSIIGGEAWATERIDTYIGGSDAWVKTEMIAGILPQQAERLDQLQTEIEAKNTHLRQILDYFGLVNVDLDKIRAMIENTQGPARKGMALRAKYLAQAGKALQELLAEKTAVVAEIGPAPQDAEITIRERIYPNVVVSIANKKRKIDKEIGPITFGIYQDRLIAE